VNALKPLIDSSSSDRARELLRAARADRPRSTAAQRTLAALGVAGTTTAVATAALGSAAVPAGSALGVGGALSLPAIAAKWVLVGTLSGLALASGATLAFSKREAAPAAHAVPFTPSAKQSRIIPVAAPAHATDELPAPSEPEAEPAPVEPLHEAAAAAPRVAPAASAGKVEAERTPFTAPSQAAFDAPEQSRLLRDIALLDAARRALKSGNAAQASALLSRYDTDRQTHVLDREAQLLRIDVLVAQGQRQRAKVLAEAYLSSFPNDTHASHLRSVTALAQ
jgi:hypothetical protein